MKARELKQPKQNASVDAEQAKGHQVPAMQLVYTVALVVFGFFVAYSLLGGLLGAFNTVVNVSPVFWVLLSFLMVFMQLNHLLADQLTDYTARLRSQQLEIVDYLRQQMSIWLQLSSIEVNLPPAISRFGRLSETFQFTQIPVLHTPIQFRS